MTRNEIIESAHACMNHAGHCDKCEWDNRACWGGMTKTEAAEWMIGEHRLTLEEQRLIAKGLRAEQAEREIEAEIERLNSQLHEHYDYGTSRAVGGLRFALDRLKGGAVMDVKELIQVAEYAVSDGICNKCKHDGMDTCLSGTCRETAKAILAIRDHYESMLQRQADIHDKVCDGLMVDFRRHGRAEVIAEIREWADMDAIKLVAPAARRRLREKLDELAGEERLETNTDDPIREIVKLAGETFNGR